VKGAIGLMQLMPGTAAMLGVNPRDPLDNLRGGIAYLSGLLRTYNDVRLALIAYNAGPDHANRVIRGEVTIFPETRRYLDDIGAIYSLDERR
jgi:soluble lytic murein transglycosylase-like protein